MSQAEKSGLYLGRRYDDRGRKLLGKLIYEGERHAILFGPNGSGKGTRFLMPNLLGDYLRGRSAIVIDPKGELAAVCASARYWMEDERAGSVKILDPFGKLHQMVSRSPAHRYMVEHELIDSIGFDPLAWLDPKADSFYDDAAAIGEALIKIEGNEPHWSESAQGLITGLVMWEVVREKEQGESASLENVRRMLTERVTFNKKDKTNGEDRDEEEDGDEAITGLAATAREAVEKCSELDTQTGELKIVAGLEIASLLGRFTEITKELASVQSTADTQTRWLLSRRMRADLGKPDGIDFRELRRAPTTVFVILPAERMRTHGVWLRLVIVSALRAMYREDGLRTMFLLDELATLGHLGPLEDAFGLVRGFGVQIVGVLQDLAQLKALYKERWESFLANAGVVQGFTPNDLTTAEWMSKRSGQMTITLESGNQGRGMGGNSNETRNEGAGWSQMARPLYLPHDLFGMAEGSGVLWLAGEADTVRFAADKYVDLPTYAERAMKNPYYKAGH